MNVTLVDSNIILDVATEDARWCEWSSNALGAAANASALAINPLIYAEVSVGFSKIEDLELAIPTFLYQRELLPF